MGIAHIIIILVLLTLIGIQLTGIYVSFSKRWYIGIASLIIPGFAFIVGVFKLFNKDILK